MSEAFEGDCMKKKWYVFFVVILLAVLLGISQFTTLKYDINLLEYINYSNEFTEEEEKIIKKYTPLIYGGNINDPPLGMYYEDNGQYIGLVIDHISALSIELRTDIISKPMVWDEALEALTNEETNICDMIPSAERKKYYEFTDPIYSLTGVIIVRKDNEQMLDNIDWANITIAGQKSDYALEHIQHRISLENIVYTDDIKESLDLLEKGLVTAVVGDEPVIRYYLNEPKYRDNYKISPDILYRTNCSLAVPKSQKELIPVLNKAIFKLKQNGTIPKINNKWFSSASFTAYQNTLKLKYTVVLLFLASFIGGYTVYMWNRSLKNLVDIKTQELEHTKNELEITFNAIKDYIVILDGEGRIKNINTGFLKNLGIPLQDILDKNYQEIPLIEAFEKNCNGIIGKVLDENIPNERETFKNSYDFSTEEGIFRLKLYPLEYGPYTIGRIAIMIEDITRQKFDEEKLTQENKMSAIGQLAAGVAHELRNPLGIIRNSTFLMSDSYEDDELRTMALNSIDSAIERSSKIISNLLNFSRKNPNVCEVVNIKDLIEEITLFFNTSLKGNRINLTTEIDGDLNIEINDTSLRHILMNLIQNAIDAIGSDGNIKIYASLNNSRMILKVENDGDLIDKKDLSRIFEPFYTTKEIGEGTGLGLYIVYTEAQKLHGEISVESSEEKTVFTLNTPINC